MGFVNLNLVQLLLAFASATVLRRLIFNRFFIQWISIYTLNYYLPPSEEKLRNVKRIGDERMAAETRRNRGKNKGSPPKGSPQAETKRARNDFDIDVMDLECFEFKTRIMTVRDLELANFSDDLEWIGDLALTSLLCYLITDLQFFIFPSERDLNFGTLWALLVVASSARILFVLTVPYFKHSETLFAKTIIVTSCLGFFGAAMFFLMLSDTVLDFKIQDAYDSTARVLATNSTLIFQDRRPLRSVSLVAIKIVMSIVVSLTGLIFAIPGLRYGTLQERVLREFDAWDPLRILSQIAHYCPLVISLLWVDLVVARPVKFLFWMSDNTYDTFRIYFILISCFLRFFMAPYYLQTFLLSVDDKMDRLRERGGTTTSLKIQGLVAHVNGHINITALQYILPVFITGYMTLIAKNMGGHTWLPNIFYEAYLTYYVGSTEGSGLKTMDNIPMTSGFFQNATKLSPEMMHVNQLKLIFTPEVCRGLMSFMMFWFQFAWFAVTHAGLYIEKRFAN